MDYFELYERNKDKKNKCDRCKAKHKTGEYLPCCLCDSFDKGLKKDYPDTFKTIEKYYIESQKEIEKLKAIESFFYSALNYQKEKIKEHGSTPYRDGVLDQLKDNISESKTIDSRIKRGT